MITTRAKLAVGSVRINTDTGNPDGRRTSETLFFTGVCKDGQYPPDGSDEDNSFCLWSPCINLEIQVNNPALWDKFKPGQKFYIDFTEAV